MLLSSGLAFVIAQGATPIVVEGQKASQEATQVVCKQAAKTNTRFGKRTCKTRAQWEQISEQNRREAEEVINKPSFGSGRAD